MNIEGQKMETYKIFVVPMGNEKNTQEVEFQPRATVIKYQARKDLDNKEVPKDSVAPRDIIYKSKEDFLALRAEIDKSTK